MSGRYHRFVRFHTGTRYDRRWLDYLTLEIFHGAAGKIPPGRRNIDGARDGHSRLTYLSPVPATKANPSGSFPTGMSLTTAPSSRSTTATASALAAAMYT